MMDVRYAHELLCTPLTTSPWGRNCFHFQFLHEEMGTEARLILASSLRYEGAESGVESRTTWLLGLGSSYYPALLL